MGYAEQRVLREVQQLKAELRRTRERERQTRQGCLDLARALQELMTSFATAGAAACPGASELVAHAGTLFAPDATQ